MRSHVIKKGKKKEKRMKKRAFKWTLTFLGDTLNKSNICMAPQGSSSKNWAL
jgi:hypothetical protein